MRLFPPTCSDSEHHQSSHDHGSIYDGLDLLAAMLGPAGYVWAASRGKRFAIHTKSIAYGTAVMVPFALHNRYVEQRAAAYSTRSDNMPVPRPVYVDRLSHFDVDNAMLLGGLVSLSMFRRTAHHSSSKNDAAKNQPRRMSAIRPDMDSTDCGHSRLVCTLYRYCGDGQNLENILDGVRMQQPCPSEPHSRDLLSECSAITRSLQQVPHVPRTKRESSL